MRPVTKTRMWHTIDRAVSEDDEVHFNRRLMSWYGNTSHLTSQYEHKKIDVMSRVL